MEQIELDIKQISNDYVGKKEVVNWPVKPDIWESKGHEIVVNEPSEIQIVIVDELIVVNDEMEHNYVVVVVIIGVVIITKDYVKLVKPVERINEQQKVEHNVITVDFIIKRRLDVSVYLDNIG